MKKIVALVLSLVMVMGLAVTAFAAFDEEADYYIKEKGSASFSGTVAAFVPADADDDGTGNIDHFLHDGVQYVVCEKADATHEIWDGNMAGDKRVAYVEAAEADYDYVMTKVAANATFSCSTDKNVKGYKYVTPVGATVYYKDSTTSGEYALVGDEVVQVVAQSTFVAAGTPFESAVASHALVFNKAAALDAAETVYEAKCVVCGAIFNVTNSKTAGVTYAPYLPNTTTLAAYGANGYDVTTNAVPALGYYLVVADAPVVDTEKVESAQTFDAGIAMYVGMSVMAAAGSAVVLKKKD